MHSPTHSIVPRVFILSKVSRKVTEITSLIIDVRSLIYCSLETNFSVSLTVNFWSRSVRFTSFFSFFSFFFLYRVIYKFVTRLTEFEILVSRYLSCNNFFIFLNFATIKDETVIKKIDMLLITVTHSLSLLFIYFLISTYSLLTWCPLRNRYSRKVRKLISHITDVTYSTVKDE